MLLAMCFLATGAGRNSSRLTKLEAHECRPFLTITPVEEPAPLDIPDTRFELTPLGESR